MKLKDMKEKHDHKFTDILKVGIFALLMIAPLFASISQMLYATFNKNAHESYYGETINQRETINVNLEDLTTNVKYTWSKQTYSANAAGYFANTFYINSLFINNQEITTYNRFRFWRSTDNSVSILLYEEDNNQWQQEIINNTANTIEFILSSIVDTGSNFNGYDYVATYYYKYNKDSYLDNAFYYGVDQMTKSDLFNWTQNTAIYTGVKAMTDNLQIQTPAIAILIVYWFILTIIYIIIDIVIKCFTAVTHLL